MNQQATLKKRSRRDTNKERVIRQALSCFVEKGIEATKISDIAKLANITDRSIYRYFATKADLVLETALLFWSEAMAQVDAQAHMELDGDICGADCIPRILQGYANLYFTHRQMLIFVHEAEAYLNRSGKALLVEKNLMKEDDAIAEQGQGDWAQFAGATINMPDKTIELDGEKYYPIALDIPGSRALAAMKIQEEKGHTTVESIQVLWPDQIGDKLESITFFESGTLPD